MIDARIHASAGGAILFDAALAAQADEAWFDPAAWEARGLLEGHGGGRGRVTFVRAPFGACALRHYHRGGMVARVLGDRYLWTGMESTRSFAEFRLLAALRGRGLPVPAPVAARYRRRGVHYTADLLTRRIEASQTLAQHLREGRADARLLQRVGALIARFHAAGIYHADLNAHNVLIAADGLYLIDFDRGELRAPARGWQRANLARLRRSLMKVLNGAGPAGGEGPGGFEDALWTLLMRGYETAMEAA
ncbi:3-deoxy-D-manno-octulosonic acid kinase [Mizugakiibacter sediminis]|uniref:3-deoxy-D-manno-octulosonic acid kinase n=1 Tax=Mizugakiibacter sediminis TaxID=1475481 RepID=A0A0K8QM07_9GAMM|nr:3-deoxy-D-manno-octulosonic acid kinase [Mizugakiibacter sediminis]GAP65909.1 3-deoxy-D-manno-octulosonic acid kinase [Mizugakiibacter sediminis]